MRLRDHHVMARSDLRTPLSTKDNALPVWVIMANMAASVWKPSIFTRPSNQRPLGGY